MLVLWSSISISVCIIRTHPQLWGCWGYSWSLLLWNGLILDSVCGSPQCEQKLVAYFTGFCSELVFNWLCFLSSFHSIQHFFSNKTSVSGKRQRMQRFQVWCDSCSSSWASPSCKVTQISPRRGCALKCKALIFLTPRKTTFTSPGHFMNINVSLEVEVDLPALIQLQRSSQPDPSSESGLNFIISL